MPQCSLKPISDAESHLGELLESAPDAILQLDKEGSISLRSSVGRANMKRVLVADDYASIRQLIRAVLEDSGYLVFEASDGVEAVCSARKFLPDLIILDLDMPSLDGFGAVREIRLDQRFRVTPIIAFSGTAIQDGRERALSAGFTSFMAKPFALDALPWEMARLLGATAPSSRR